MHLKISSHTLDKFASHLMTNYITCSIFAVKSAINITIVKKCIFPSLLKRSTTIGAAQWNEQHLFISLEKLNKADFGKEFAVGLKLTKQMHFGVTRPMFNKVIWVQGDDLVET